MGRKIKTQAKWSLVPGSVVKITAEQAAQVVTAISMPSSYKEGMCYLAVTLMDGGVVNMPQMDLRLDAQPGESWDPKSIILAEFTNGEKTITRTLAARL